MRAEIKPTSTAQATTANPVSQHHMAAVENKGFSLFSFFSLSLFMKKS